MLVSAIKTQITTYLVTFCRSDLKTIMVYLFNIISFIWHTPSTEYYSAGEEKSPYFLFHGETALRKILKFQGETANFSEKFQGEIAQFLRENGAS